MTGASPASAAAPVGVFDSGVGGLSVLKEIRAQMPHEDLLYVADSGHIPWGEKPTEEIRRYALGIAHFLTARGAKAIVIACNAGTAAAAETLRATLSVPVIAMEPAVKPAAAATKSGVVGVLLTSAAARSDRFQSLLERFGSTAVVVTQPAPGLVEHVEAGDLNGPQTRALVDRYMERFRQAGVDTIVLGCTHYPFLRPLIEELAGNGVTVLDTGAAVARQLRRILDSSQLLNDQAPSGTVRFWTSGDLEEARRVIPALYGEPAQVDPLPIPVEKNEA